ncbi:MULTISPECIES: hypothetical protein [unclassified Streptomyces]|uniref:hypothetical protein n=1 Tax=unclassified Streptomyces TaxID=2593676 RepID=UPI002258A04F|nr:MULTISPECIES: hypothetical protein [unclassified Streptomyces]MCX4871108.1 hypothetical protein [Streptomyces sp. NBC_00906]MCX4902730.1 hypothetical protein [Streptomyces sp. NBC_00892]
MNAFDQMAAAGSLLGIGMQIADVSIDLRETMEQYKGDVQRASRHGGLRGRWAQAEPETRSALLLNLAWASREAELDYGADADGAFPEHLDRYAAGYAEDFHGYASGFRDGSEAFHGKAFPAMPLPGQAGALASSLGFDRDDTDISLKTALILLAPVYKAAQP